MSRYFANVLRNCVLVRVSDFQFPFSLVIFACLNLPPWIRFLPGFVVLMAVIPGPTCRNFQTYLKFIAFQFDSVFVRGLRCFNAHEQKEV